MLQRDLLLPRQLGVARTGQCREKEKNVEMPRHDAEKSAVDFNASIDATATFRQRSTWVESHG